VLCPLTPERDKTIPSEVNIMAAAKATAPEKSFLETLTENAQEVREPGPSSGQNYFLVQLLCMELEANGAEQYNEELRELLRTRRGASALISHLKAEHNIPDKD
jgi:hypothetical protein